MIAMVFVPLLVLIVALVALATHWAPRIAASLALIADSLDVIADVARRRPAPGVHHHPALPYGGDLVRAVRGTHERVNGLERHWLDVGMLRREFDDHLRVCAAQPDVAAAVPADKPDEHTESNP